MTESTPFHISWRPTGATRVLLCGEAAISAADVLVVLSAVSAFALCRDFLDWAKWEVDSSVVIALAMIVVFVASFAWFVRLVLQWMIRQKVCSPEKS